MLKRGLIILLVLAPLALSLGLEREARRREQLADQQEARLQRIENDQAAFESARLRLRGAAQAVALRQRLLPLQSRQRRLLTMLRPLLWRSLEWAPAGFYVEGPAADGLEWSDSTRERERLAGRWE